MCILYFYSLDLTVVSRANHPSIDHFAVENPPSDVISAVQFSPEPDSTRFVVSSWDKNVYLYDLRDENGTIGEGKLIQKFEHRAPVLDVCFGQNEDELYTGGLDWDVRKSVLASQVDEHALTTRCVALPLQDRCTNFYSDGVKLPQPRRKVRGIQ